MSDNEEMSVGGLRNALEKLEERLHTEMKSNSRLCEEQLVLHFQVESLREELELLEELLWQERRDREDAIQELHSLKKENSLMKIQLQEKSLLEDCNFYGGPKKHTTDDIIHEITDEQTGSDQAEDNFSTASFTDPRAQQSADCRSRKVFVTEGTQTEPDSSEEFVLVDFIFSRIQPEPTKSNQEQTEPASIHNVEPAGRPRKSDCQLL